MVLAFAGTERAPCRTVRSAWGTLCRDRATKAGVPVVEVGADLLPHVRQPDGIEA